MNFSIDRSHLFIALDRSHKFQVIKLKALLGKLHEFEKTKYFDSDNREFIEFICSIKASSLITNCTDFFWSLVHRLSSDIDKGEKEEIMRTYGYFILSAFDSVFTLLPSKIKISFKGIDDKELILPKLGVSLKSYSGKVLTLLKFKEDAINYRVSDYEHITDSTYNFSLVDLPIWFKLREEKIGNTISVIYQSNENIFENHYYIDCCDDYFLGHLLKEKIELALAKIKLIDNNLFERIIAAIDYIIPYGSDINKKYPNFTIATLKRTIFLSIELLMEHEVFISESIIHEFSHCELHIVQDTVLLTNIENNVLEYYSPWRKDPRPLLGLLHAIYISHELTEFYDTYLQKENTDSQEKELVKNKLILIIHQVLIALKQIKENHLTDFSRTMITEIRIHTNRISDDLKISLATFPEEIREHKVTWRKQNPGMSIVE